MRFSKWAIIAGMLVFATSCGENSTKDNTTTKDTTVATTSPLPGTETFTVPQPVQTTFNEKYPGVQNVNWSRYQASENIDWELAGWPMLDSNAYTARFSTDSADYMAWYDNNNNWVASVATVKNNNNLPAAVNKRIKSDFPGYTIVSIDKEYDHSRTAYEIKLTKGDDKVRALISESGEMMKKKSMINGEKTKEKMSM
jgi:ABC-type glycerol-3-phosphate transport system substrate-binding protein